MQVSLPFKDQTSANAVKRQMRDLSNKISTTLQPVFICWKLEQDLKPRGIKLPIVNQQGVVYSFICDQCDSDYVSFTARHLYQRFVEHKYSAIGKHFSTAHGDTSLLKERQYHILKMLFIKQCNPSLNTQTDSTRAKLFFLKEHSITYCFLVFKHFLSFTHRLNNDVSQTSKRRQHIFNML